MIVFVVSFIFAALLDNAYGYLAVSAALLFSAGMRFERDRADGLLDRWPRDPREGGRR